MKFTSILLSFGLIISSASYTVGAESEKTTYRLAIPKAIENFDPINSESQINSEIISNLYSTLVTYRTKITDTKQSYGDIVPLIAEDININSNRKIYNFKLRNDIYFHNGRNLTAFDVKHTIERLANPKVLPSGQAWIFRDVPIKGLEKYSRDVRNNVKEPDLSGVKVLDDYIVQIELTRATPLFLKSLAMPIFSIIPKEETDKWGKEFGVHPVGTGPYKIDRVTAEQIFFTKNPNYFEKDLPKIDNLIYKVVSSVEDEYKLFEQGRLEQTSIPDSKIDDLLEKENFNKLSVNVFDKNSFNDKSVSDIIKEPKMISTFLGISNKNKMLKLQKVRQALNYSINKSKIISNVLKYKAIDSYGVIPENFPGVNSGRKSPYPFDIVKAKKLLYESGFNDRNNDGILEYNKKPVTLNLWYYEDQETERVCNTISENLQAVGFNVNLQKTTNWKDFLSKIVSGRADLYHFSWKAKYEDMDKYLSPMFNSAYIGSSNIASFSDTYIDSMLTKARKIPEEEYRNRIYNELDSKIVEKAPWVFLYQPASYIKVKPYVYSLQVHPVMREVLKYTYFKKGETLALDNK
ncbi:MAG: ABC transporter substrate-binding protein [Candidatus Sericytochromatia bacterium]